MLTRYRRRQVGVGQVEINQKKLVRARELLGRQVVIAGAARDVVGFSETTGDIEVQVGSRVMTYDPFGVIEVQK